MYTGKRVITRLIWGSGFLSVWLSNKQISRFLGHVRGASFTMNIDFKVMSTSSETPTNYDTAMKRVDFLTNILLRQLSSYTKDHI